MRLVVIPLLLLFFTFSLLGSEAPQKLLNIVNEEIRITSAIKRPSIDIRYKVFELHNEKLALVFEIENGNFLKAKPEERAKLGKEGYFLESHTLYKKCIDLSNALFNDYPNNKYSAEIYYLMGLIHRDFNSTKKAEQSLLKAQSLAGKKKALLYNIEVTLAEFFYNEKKYNEAINYYERVTENTKDEWLTKHLYNRAWVLLKLKKFDNSINVLNHALEISRKEGYVNIADQIISKASVFYTLAGKVVEGITFIERESTTPNSALISFADFASEKRPHDEVHNILMHSLAKAKSPVEEVASHVSLLSYYGKFNLYQEHFDRASILATIYKKEPTLLKNHDLKIIDELTKVVGYFQIKVNKDSKRGERAHKEDDLHKIINYFTYLSLFDSNESAKYSYLKGETYYQLTLYREAGMAYQDSILIEEKKEKDKKIDSLRKTMMALLAVVEMNDDQKLKKELELFTYPRFIELFPTDQISPPLYHKLFALYLEDKNIDKGNETFEKYVKSFPTHLEDQRKMIMAIIDNAILEKNATKLGTWIARIEKNSFGFDQTYIEKAIGMLGKILFFDHRKEINDGKSRIAIIGLTKILEDKKYPKTTQAEARLILAEALLNEQKFNEAAKEAKQSFELFADKDRDYFFLAYKRVAAILHDSFELAYSKEVIQAILPFACQNKKGDELYSTFFDIELALGDYDSIVSELNEVTSKDGCQLKADMRLQKTELLFNHLIRFGEFQRVIALKPIFMKLKNGEEIFAEKMQSFMNIPKYHQEAFEMILSMPNTKIAKEYRHIDEKIADIRSRVEFFMKKRIKQLDEFNGTRFNANLSKYLGTLQTTKDDIIYLMRKESPEVVKFGNKKIVEIYTKASDELKAQKINGAPAEFALSFANEMNKLADGLLGVAKYHQSEVAKFSVDSNINYQAETFVHLLR